MTFCSVRPLGLLRFGCGEPGIPVVTLSEAIVVDTVGYPCLDDATAAREIRGGPARLEVRVAAKIVMIDGTRQHVPERPFELLKRVVERACGAGGPISAHEFEEKTGLVAADVLRKLKRALTKQRPNAAEVNSWFDARRTTGVHELILDPARSNSSDRQDLYSTFQALFRRAFCPSARSHCSGWCARWMGAPVISSPTIGYTHVDPARRFPSAYNAALPESADEREGRMSYDRQVGLQH